MARPKKIGLDYFPLDTVWDEKIKILLSVFGNDGLSWIITFWQFAYCDEFGRVNTNKYFGEILAKESRNTTEKQSEIVKMALEIKLIKEVEPGVYTSSGIQKRIKSVSSERGSALKRYYDKREKKVKIPKEIKEKIKESKVKDFGDTSEKYIFNLPPHLSIIWPYYLEMRKLIKKPATQKAQGGIVEKLEKLAPGDNQKQIQIIQQSIDNSWQGVFPLKENQQQSSSHPYDRL